MIRALESLYPVRNNAPLLSPSQRLSRPEALRARLRPGRAHAQEGGLLSEPEALLSRRLGRRLQRGYILNNSGFRPVGRGLSRLEINL